MTLGALASAVAKLSLIGMASLTAKSTTLNISRQRGLKARLNTTPSVAQNVRGISVLGGLTVPHVELRLSSIKV